MSSARSLAYEIISDGDVNHFRRFSVFEDQRSFSPDVVFSRDGRQVPRHPVDGNSSVTSVGPRHWNLCRADTLLDQETRLLKLEDSRICTETTSVY